MSDLTQEQLSELIALKHEKKPRASKGSEQILSFEGWWYRQHELVETTYGERVEPYGPWKAVSIEEPRISMRLLKELLVMGWHYTFWPNEGGNITMHFSNGHDFHKLIGQTIEQLAALAYAKAVGLDVEG